MGAKLKFAVILVAAIGMFVWASVARDGWLCQTMPRHQGIQLPAMLAVGVLLALGFHKVVIRDTSWAVAILVLVMGSLVFWMLPRSVDRAVIEVEVNRVMWGNMILAGFFVVVVLRGAMTEVRVEFFGMLAAMLLATGFVLRVYDLLLCGSFTVAQQQMTGLVLIGYGLLAAVGAVWTLLAGVKNDLARRTKISG